MSALTKGIFIVGAKRTPFGALSGKLAGKTCTDLQTVAAKAALVSANVQPEAVDSVVIGFQAVVTGAHDILLGGAHVVVAGGSDNMSQAPHALRGLRTGVRLGAAPQLEDMMWEALTDQHVKTPMGVTAENLADKYSITRQDADRFAIASQQKWKTAQEEGRFREEMAPVALRIKKQDVSMDMDEHPKPASTPESIGKLPPVFKKDGTVTAATASGICDGAGALVLASEAAVKQHGLQPLVRLVGYAVVGVDPSIMGIGPAPAVRRVLELADLKLADVGLVEINEAFAAQALACQKELGLDPARLNVSGGAIAIGHPLAASGARITAHLTHEMRRRQVKYAVGAACIGGGQGIALLLEAV